MMFAEIINTCTNENIAEAAVASISVVFLNEIRRVADGHDMSVGEYAAGLVRRFHWRASDLEHAAMARAMDGSQAPVLAGLRYILETMMEEDENPESHPGARSSRMRDPLQFVA
jgi:hypothetical protein